MTKITVSSADHGRRLDQFLARAFDRLPISRIARALREKNLKINGKIVIDRKQVLKTGDVLTIYGLDLAPAAAVATAHSRFDLKVIYEDEHILVINKPHNLEMHGARSLDAAVFAHLQYKPNGAFVPAAIGQLDKTTSGVIIYGKTYAALHELNSKQALFTKIYDFIAKAVPSQEVTVKIAHNELLRREEIAPQGKIATTRFFEEGAVQHAELITGRKHQIRVTLSHLGSPIRGDVKYGGEKADRVYLHASKLVLRHLEAPLSHLNERVFESKPGWDSNGK